MLFMLVVHAVAVALHPVVHQLAIMEMVTIELVKVVVTLFPVHLLYASLTNLETVFKVLQLTPKSQKIGLPICHSVLKWK